ncbi:unnamed protein product, partial [Pylaiella littoralis]
ENRSRGCFVLRDLRWLTGVRRNGYRGTGIWLNVHFGSVPCLDTMRDPRLLCAHVLASLFLVRVGWLTPVHQKRKQLLLFQFLFFHLQQGKVIRLSDRCSRP